MFARLSVDTGLLRDYGAACAAHSTDLDTAAARLTGLSSGPPEMFGPVAARFVASLVRAVGNEAGTLARLSACVAAGAAVATEAAGTYDVSDDGAATRIAGVC
jgi:hypothetical protein